MDALFCPDAGGSARKSALPLVWGKLFNVAFAPNRFKSLGYGRIVLP
jgi:hypothetical protein